MARNQHHNRNTSLNAGPFDHELVAALTAPMRPRDGSRGRRKGKGGFALWQPKPRRRRISLKDLFLPGSDSNKLLGHTTPGQPQAPGLA